MTNDFLKKSKIKGTSSPWLKSTGGIDMIDPTYYTAAWPWVDAQTEDARPGCGLPRMSCLLLAVTRFINA